MSKSEQLPEHVLFQSFLKSSPLPTSICRHGEGVVEANKAFLTLCGISSLPELCPVSSLLGVDDLILDGLETKLKSGPIEVHIMVGGG